MSFSSGVINQLDDEINGDAAGDGFGYSVSLSGSGDMMGVGAPDSLLFCGYAKVYYYNTTSKKWEQNKIAFFSGEKMLFVFVL